MNERYWRVMQQPNGDWWITDERQYLRMVSQFVAELMVSYLNEVGNQTGTNAGDAPSV
jgi:hypothetical protein